MSPSVEPFGESALLLRWAPQIDGAINRQVHALAARIAARRPPWLRDLVPAYASLALVLDDAAFPELADPLAEAEAWLRPLLDAPDEADAVPVPPLIEIPVCYGGEFGPDLADVAAHAGLSMEETIARHAGAEYTVALLGFAPGFPYLLGLDPALATPRLATPRTKVPAGSVGIGGAQTGLYPRESPGGWRLIGRTPLIVFDPLREPPALLAPGDRVRFVPVGPEAFARRHGAHR